MKNFLRPLGVCWLGVGIAVGPQVATAQLYPPLPIRKDGTAVLLTDYANLPLSSRTPNNFTYASYPPAVDFAQQLGRVNFLRSEPPGAPLAATRFFVCDLNRNFYIFDKSNQTFGVYLDFEAIFPKFDNNPGYAGGLVTFQFDPRYANNGIFYTVHTEDPIKGNSESNPVNPNAVLPAGYTVTAAVNPPVGSVMRDSVLVEWTDTNIANAIFEGTAREILRIGFNGNVHPMGDLIFNPLAGPADDDFRNLYVACGDGAAGEQTDSRHHIPQRLDSLQGKILRLTPDLGLRPGLSVVSANGRYRIPAAGDDPNPFVHTNGARAEIFTYGHRNPHRLAWDAASNTLLVFEIGLSSFEEINIVHKGANYGYADREGTKRLVPPGGTYSTAPPGYGLSDLPEPDTLPIRITDSATSTRVPVRYAAAEYFQTEGDGIACGYVYRGNLAPELRGACIFGDITTGRLFYCHLAEMIAADDTNPATLAPIHELQIVFDNPADTPDQGAIQRRMFDLVRDEYHSKGGTVQALPGVAATTGGNDSDGVPYGGGRADIRVAEGGDGELYVLSKSDGCVRQLTSLTLPLHVGISATSSNAAVLTWNSIPGWLYRLQYRTNLADAPWVDVMAELRATETKTTAPIPLGADSQCFYRVQRRHP